MSGFPDELVEKVARDICAAEWGRKEQWDWMIAKDDISLQTYRRVARASLSATFAWMREANARMIGAGGNAVEDQYGEHPEWEEAKDAIEGLDVVPIFSAMLDAINPPEE